MTRQEIIPLSKVQDGAKVKVAKIDAGRGLNSRLASMGIIANTELIVVSNRHPGPFVVSVRNSRLILGRGIAQKIMVK